MEPPARMNEEKDASSTMQCSSASVPHEADELYKNSSDAAAPSDDFTSSADAVKEEGLRAFRAGDWRSATDAWSRGLRTLEYILAREDEFDEDKKKEFVTMQQSYLLNLSLSTLKEGRWAACILYCDKALQRDPKALKALYRKAQAQQGLGDFDGALATIDRYLSVSPDSPLAVSLQTQLRHLKAAHAVKEKKLLQGMFRNLEHDPRSEAAAAAAAAEAATKNKGLLGSVKDWFRGSGSKQQPSTDGAQQQSQNIQEDIATVQRAMRAAGMNSTNSNKDCNEGAMAEAVAALFGGKDKPGNANIEELKKLTSFLNKYQTMHGEGASFMDKMKFRVSLVWFGIQHICASIGCKLCQKRKRSQGQEQTGHEWEDLRSTASASSSSPPSGFKVNRDILNRTPSRQKGRVTEATAANRRRQRQQLTKGTTSRNKVEDLGELSASES
ncbi:hypothetical protein, conserved [Eimeria brunetti]|uniref:peptidylprolyl isomerase n=1 Tax=Eimeria brunetti TaxID=51314 RepID=U6LVB8_9EIME|nr:hypothetical protein, conserved [Eimeria brunetti]